MKKFKTTWLVLSVLCLSLLFSATAFAQGIDPTNTTTVQGHVTNLGWQDPVVYPGQAGTEGMQLGLEAIRINTGVDPAILGAQYQVHVQGIGWQDPVATDQVAGTEGQARPIEAVRIQLTGSEAPNYQVYYQAHSANFGWLGWATDNQDAGSTGCGFPLEALRVTVVPRGTAAPGATDHPSISVDMFEVKARAHVSGQGWQNFVYGGDIGTIGQKMPIEAIDLEVNDPTGKSGVQGQAYLKNIGWQNMGNKNDPIGTTGLNIPIEAIRYDIVGPAAQLFDIQYHTHVTNIGWMPWTANREPSGTSGANLNVEAASFLLSPKAMTRYDANPYKEIAHPYGTPMAPTCIVMSLSKQRMALYKNYDIICDTNIVTGMNSIDPTKPGEYTIQQKLNYFRTVGPGYDAICKYWLTLYWSPVWGFDRRGYIPNGTIGIHDAGWRTDWSSRAYLYNGSHGCVNTPYNNMAFIWNNVEVGTPVSIH